MLLDGKLAMVTALARIGQLPDARLDGGELKITPLKATTPPEADVARNAAYDLLPRIRITDLLMEVDRWTGFSACFTHQRTGRAAEDRTALMATVLADGINLGLTRMAETCSGVTSRRLAWVHDWHIREETYAAALARLVDAHRALPLSSVWGNGSSSSSDGQYFRSGSQGSGLGDVNARHGSEPGVAFYTHISDQFGPFHTKVIAVAASEAPRRDDVSAHRGLVCRFLSGARPPVRQTRPARDRYQFRWFINPPGDEGELPALGMPCRPRSPVWCGTPTAKSGIRRACVPIARVGLGRPVRGPR